MVLRTQKDFNNRNTYIGGIFTATNRSLKNNFPNLHESAYSGGLDFRHNWKNRNYFVEGNVVVSKVLGSKAAIERTQRKNTHNFQRIDASHVNVDPNKTSLTGTGGKIVTGKSGGGNWRFNGGLEWLSPELELNDIGFLRQADKIKEFVDVEYKFLKPTETYRDASIILEQNHEYDFEGNFNVAHYELKGKITWKNNWWSELAYGTKSRVFSNTFLRGGPRWQNSNRTFLVAFFGSDRQKKFNFTMGHVRAFVKDKSYKFSMYRFGLNYQPTNSLNFSLSGSLRSSPNKAQYVTQRSFGTDTRYVLGNIDFTTLSTSLRINYSINPNLSVQFYGSPFITKGKYNDFNYVTNPTAKNINNRVQWYNSNQISENNNEYLVDENLDGTTDYTFDNPDFSFVQFQSNLVVRWEYIPGSEIFLVWSRGTSGSADINDSLFSAIGDRVFNQPSEDTFLIKATYRFVM